MAQDSDVARVAAALKAPGFKYRSFGNEPVRNAPVASGNVAETYPLLGAAMESAAATPMHGASPPDDGQADPAGYAPPLMPAGPEDGHATPAPSAAPMMAPLPEPPMAAAMPAPAGFPPPPAQPFPDPPRAAAPQMTSPPTGIFAQLQQPAGGYPAAPAAYPAPSAWPDLPPAPAEASPGSYRLLESIGRQADLNASLAPPPAFGLSAGAPGFGGHPAPAGPTGTFGALLAGSAGGMAPAAIAHPHPPAPGWASSPRSPSLLPAAMVTMPLAEVMRLVALGAPAASTPFAAFRVAGGLPHAR